MADIGDTGSTGFTSIGGSSITFKRLYITNDTNFIHIKQPSAGQGFLISKIIAPSQAITGYQLNILIGPDLTINQGVATRGAIGFAYRSTNSVDWMGNSQMETNGTNFNYEPNNTLNAHTGTNRFELNARFNTNIIWPDYANGIPFNEYGLANVVYDPTNGASGAGFGTFNNFYPRKRTSTNPTSSGSIGLDDDELFEMRGLRRKPKLLKFVYVQNYRPLRWNFNIGTDVSSGSSLPQYSMDPIGNYWILQDITVLQGFRTFSNNVSQVKDNVRFTNSSIIKQTTTNNSSSTTTTGPGGPSA